MVHRLSRVLTRHAFVIGLGLRLLLAWALPVLLDDGLLMKGVKYTDIDFHVFSDAADHVAHGRSPYDRHTYRYTPFLALLLACLPRIAFGRYLFCLADAICGSLIIRLRRRVGNSSLLLREARFTDALWWMYNPLAINICTRGSAESLVVLLPVLVTVTLAQKRTMRRAALAGLVHGIAVHAKLYPIIYTVSFMAHFSRMEWSEKLPPIVWSRSSQEHRGGTRSAEAVAVILKRVYKLFWFWVERLCSSGSLVFFGAFLSTFAGLTYIAVVGFGIQALQEGLLYHFSRLDHRHNYSMYWYWIYLLKGREVPMSSSVYLLIPQAVLLAFTSLGVAPYDLPLALFVQTFLFVAHNKVITAQYFTWYLCLLPLCDIAWFNRKIVGGAGLLGLSIVTWLGSAYLLEMQGLAVHRMVWLASVGFFVANCNLLGALLHGYSAAQKDVINNNPGTEKVKVS